MTQLKNSNLLTRNNFRESVFKRDNYKCVICGLRPSRSELNDLLSAHHIIERRLFADGGYYIDNGASLCDPCHLKAESTSISCEEIRQQCGITNIILPEHLYSDLTYDKWGNVLNHNGRNIPGELFWDESVKKIMGDIQKTFCKYIKYPRTYHVPWSQKNRSDDKYLKDMSHFSGKRVIITEKMDGENTALYNDYIHSRSLDSKTHKSRDWIKNFHSKISYLIPEEMRIYGENLYGRHTVEYDNLSTYFMGFSAWVGDKCLNWGETLEFFELIGIQSVPVLFDGLYENNPIDYKEFDGINKEGYVIRLADSFNMREFKDSVCKYVGNNFVLPHGHWSIMWDKNHLKKKG